MIHIDKSEPADFQMLLGQLGIEIQVGDYNKSGSSLLQWGDFTIVNEGIVTVERKQAVEAMSDLDAVEDQLYRTLATCPKVIFIYEGILMPHPDGVYCGGLTRIETKRARDGTEYEELTSRGRIIHQPWKRWESFVWKCQDDGIPVVPTGTVRGSAMFLAHLHSNPQNNLFERLLPIRQVIVETDFELRAWLLRLMSIPGCGEEVARAIAAVIPNDAELVHFLELGGVLGDLLLPSGRKLGPALEKRIRKFTGVV